MELSFSQYYQQEELSDVDVQLVRTVQQQQDNSNSAHQRQSREHGICRLASFPGHRIIHNNSPFFKAQVRMDGGPTRSKVAAFVNTPLAVCTGPPAAAK
jgi:hypothetical protein